MGPNNRQAYNDFISLLLTKEKETDYQGEEGRLKLVTWINEWTTILLAGEGKEDDPPEAKETGQDPQL